MFIAPQLLHVKRPVVVAGSSSSAALTFVAADTNLDQNSTSGGALTVAIDIGTADGNKKNIGVLLLPNSYDIGGGNVSPSSITIDGVSSTLATPILGTGGGVTEAFSGQIIFFWANVTTGGTKNIVITGGVAGGNGSGVLGIYSVDKTTLLDGSPTIGSHNVTAADAVATNTVTVNTGDGGFVIAAQQNDSLGSAASASITASTESFGTADAAYAQKGGPLYSKKSAVGVHTPFSATYSWTNNSQSIAALLHWR